MRALALLYHDVIEDAHPDSSGRPGPAAATFKIELEEFRRHVAAVARECPLRAQPQRIFDLLEGRTTGMPRMLTFDDGGSSAYDPIAGLLERLGWRGHFFVTTDAIGTPGFLSADQIRELSQRGHVIGSHSRSHPTRMSACSWERLIQEWEGSVRALTEILEHAVTVASVPGGYYSRRVARAAAAAGIRALFTSEPTTHCSSVDGCLVVGRYSVRRSTPLQHVGALAGGRCLPRWKQRVLWEGKKIAKVLGGRFYLSVRRLMLGRPSDRQVDDPAPSVVREPEAGARSEA